MESLFAANREFKQLEYDDVTAPALIGLLMDSASDLAACGQIRDLSHTAVSHRKCGIERRHYSLFGLLLAPVLRDAPGLRLAPRIATAWSDAFRFAVRQMEPLLHQLMPIKSGAAMRLQQNHQGAEPLVLHANESENDNARNGLCCIGRAGRHVPGRLHHL